MKNFTDWWLPLGLLSLCLLLIFKIHQQDKRITTIAKGLYMERSYSLHQHKIIWERFKKHHGGSVFVEPQLIPLKEK